MSSSINAPISAKKAWLLSLALLGFQLSWMNHLISCLSRDGSAAPSPLAVSSDIRSALHKMTKTPGPVRFTETLQKCMHLDPFLCHQLLQLFHLNLVPPPLKKIIVSSITSNFKPGSFHGSVYTVSLFKAWAAVAQKMNEHLFSHDRVVGSG